MQLLVDLATACAARLMECVEQFVAMQHAGKAMNTINFYYIYKNYNYLIK